MKPHTGEELEHASDYLEFIIHMVEADFDFIRQNPAKSFGKNVYIDSMLVRLRSLIEFLCASDTRWDTDVIAKHYLESFSLPEEECEWLLSEKDKIDSTLAHLTIRPMPKLISEVDFSLPDMYLRVLEGLRLFFESGPPHVLDQTKDRFQEAYDDLHKND